MLLRTFRCKALNQQLFKPPRNANTCIKRGTTTTVAPQLNVATATASFNTTVGSQKLVGYWFLGCAGTVVGAVALGGLTRLTKSGLSMTDWHLVKGMKPPRTQEEWEAEFARYKEFPEYSARSDMTLKEFKFIFNMEYYHRMYGRMVGLAFYIPAGYFWARGYLNRGLKIRTVAFGSLILGQGLFGWYMVKSGLKEETCANTGIPRVSQYRLAGHLGLAFTVFSGLFYNGIGLVLKEHKFEYSKALARLKSASHASVGLVFVTAVSGAFVAGLEAGLVYNSFPKFADRWIPSDIAEMNPYWKNCFENPTTVQFNHRLLAMSAFGSIVAVLALARPVALPWRTRMAVNALFGMACVQVSLGVSTLLLYVPVNLAATHQMGSLTLLSIALWLNRELRPVKVLKAMPK